MEYDDIGKTDLRETIEQAWDYHLQALIDESDRGAAIWAAAQFEEKLREFITSKFVQLTEEPDKNIQKN